MNSNPQTAFIKEDPWRIFRIMAEFVDSFETLSQVGPSVTVFGSARMSQLRPRDRTQRRVLQVPQLRRKPGMQLV